MDLFDKQFWKDVEVDFLQALEESRSAAQIVSHVAQADELGGIDLTSDKALRVKSDGPGGIQFNSDPAMLQQLQNVPGLELGEIILQPMIDLKQFLGIQTVPRVK